MRLTVNADCMASSSAPNPYGQPQGSTGEPNLYYQTSTSTPTTADYNQMAGGGVATPSAGRRHQRPLMSSPAGEGVSEKPLLLQSSNSLAGSYDSSYLGGMSSDSELTSSSAAARHQHRPYSSQSRVYHAHPVPRPAHHQQQPATASSSSGSSTSRYLPTGVLSAGPTGAESPVSPILMHRQQQQQQQQFVHKQQAAGSGRQLPQRPFKQSMSIDQHQQHFQRAAGLSPAHQRGLMSEPLVGTSSYQQQPHQHQQQAQKLYSSSSASSAGQLYGADQYSRQVELDLVEQKTGQMSLYGSGGELADLPPLGPARSSSSSSGRQLPNIGATGFMGSISLEQHQRQHHADPFHQQHRLMQQCSQDPYAPTGEQHQHQQHHARSQMTASADWLPPLGSPQSSSGAGGLRSSHANQFKQTMSIDHYPASRQQQHQQQQSHFSPARRTDHFAGSGAAPGDQYNSPLASYKGTNSPSQQQLIGGYDSPTGSAPNQQHNAGLYYASSMEPRSQQQQQQHQSARFMADHQHHHHHQQQTTANELKHFESHHQQQPLRASRPKLQHQPSSSSSNSNLSGSQKSNALEGGANMMAPISSSVLQQQQHHHHQQQQPDNNNKPLSGELHWQKSSSVSSSHHYNAQQSPQHYKPPSGHHHGGHQSVHKQDVLRRGYTSTAVMPSSSSSTHYGAASELTGSQGALSEAGDLSVSQASGHSSGQLGKRSVPMRAPSPSIGLDTGAPHHSAPLQHHSGSSGYTREQVPVGMRSESTTGLPNGSGGSSTLTKKSNSATQLSMSGTKKRLGFRKKQVTSFSVHRSEEVAPLEARHLVKQGSSVSEGDSSMSGDSSSRSWSNSNFKQQTSEELASMSFIDGLGKGQMISRQGLASPYLGDIQLSLCDRRGNLEVEVIRARNLQAKTNKIQPLTYVKLYLVKNRKCLGKAKTTLSNKRTLNPLFQQQLTFHEDYHGCILQSIVWGNFGKMDKKNFMGIAQISIDDLELSDTVISWYKLFLPSSLQTLPSKSLRHTLLSNSTESFTNTNNS